MQKEQEKNKIPARYIVLGLLIAAAIVGLSVLLYPYVAPLADESTREQFALTVRQMGFGGVLLLLAMQVAQIIIAFIPGEPVEIVAGTMYGAFGGLAVCLAGILIGSTAVFLLVRRYGSKLVKRFFKQQDINNLAFLKTDARRDTTIFIMFLLPGTPKDVLTYVAGLTHISLGKFLLISLSARVPSVLTSTLVGGNLSSGRWQTALVIFAVTGLLGLIGIFINDRLVKRKNSFFCGDRELCLRLLRDEKSDYLLLRRWAAQRGETPTLKQLRARYAPLSGKEYAPLIVERRRLPVGAIEYAPAEKELCARQCLRCAAPVTARVFAGEPKFFADGGDAAALSLLAEKLFSGGADALLVAAPNTDGRWQRAGFKNIGQDSASEDGPLSVKYSPAAPGEENG